MGILTLTAFLAVPLRSLCDVPCIIYAARRYLPVNLRGGKEWPGLYYNSRADRLPMPHQESLR
jgi:hypothetical protein